VFAKKGEVEIGVDDRSFEKDRIAFPDLQCDLRVVIAQALEQSRHDQRAQRRRRPEDDAAARRAPSAVHLVARQLKAVGDLMRVLEQYLAGVGETYMPPHAQQKLDAELRLEQRDLPAER